MNRYCNSSSSSVLSCLSKCHCHRNLASLVWLANKLMSFTIAVSCQLFFSFFFLLHYFHYLSASSSARSDASPVKNRRTQWCRHITFHISLQRTLQSIQEREYNVVYSLICRTVFQETPSSSEIVVALKVHDWEAFFSLFFQKLKSSTATIVCSHKVRHNS